MSTPDYWIGLPVLPAMREGPPHLVEVTVTHRHETIIEEDDFWESMDPDFVGPLRPTISVLLPIEEDHYPSYVVEDDAGNCSTIHVDQPCGAANEVVVGGRYLAVHQPDEQESISLVSRIDGPTRFEDRMIVEDELRFGEAPEDLPRTTRRRRLRKV